MLTYFILLSVLLLLLTHVFSMDVVLACLRGKSESLALRVESLLTSMDITLTTCKKHHASNIMLGMSMFGAVVRVVLSS